MAEYEQRLRDQLADYSKLTGQGAAQGGEIERLMELNNGLHAKLQASSTELVSLQSALEIEARDGQRLQEEVNSLNQSLREKVEALESAMKSNGKLQEALETRTAEAADAESRASRAAEEAEAEKEGLRQQLQSAEAGRAQQDECIAELRAKVAAFEDVQRANEMRRSTQTSEELEAMCKQVVVVVRLRQPRSCMGCGLRVTPPPPPDAVGSCSVSAVLQCVFHAPTCIVSPSHSSCNPVAIGKWQASFIRIKLQWGRGGWVGGSKALDPPPLIISRVSWVGLLRPLLSLVTGALSGCLLVPLSALSLCRHHAKKGKKNVFSPHVFVLYILGIFRRIL